MAESPPYKPLLPVSDMSENANEDKEDLEDDEEDPSMYKMLQNIEVKVEMEVEEDANVSWHNDESYDIDSTPNHFSDGLTTASPPQVQGCPPGQGPSVFAATATRDWAMRRANRRSPESQETRTRSPLPSFQQQLLGLDTEETETENSPEPMRYSTPSPPVETRSSTSCQSSPDHRVDRLYDNATQSARDRGQLSQGRGQGRPRGGTTAQGGHGDTNQRTAYVASGRDIEWRRGDPIVEVCKNEDIPTGLREVLYELERNPHDTSVPSEGVSNDGDAEEKEFHAAESLIVSEMFDGDRAALVFDWSRMETFRSQSEQFQLNPGPTVKVSCPYEAFRYFWDDEILEHIVKETNRYAAGLKESSKRFAKCWYDTNVHEMLILFAFWMMLGVIRMPTIRSCFSNNPVLKTSVFRKLFTENRYWHLQKALNFADDGKRTPESSKLFFLGPVPEHLNDKFKNAYTPGQNIAIEESLGLGKGNFLFQQFIKTEAARLGMKTFELCDSATGYLWSFIIYTVKDGPTVAPRLPQTTDVVVKLMKPLLHKGYRVFMDSTLNSPLLARYLKRNKTDCLGLLRKYCLNVPALIQHAVIPEGTCVARHSGDVVVMACQDKKPVYTISTCHGTESVPFESKPGEDSHYKPAVMVDYNRYMTGIAKKDQMLEPYLVERENNRKWYINIFKYILNLSTFNSRLLVDNTPTTEVKTQAFRLELVDLIMKFHLAHVPLPRKNETTRSRVFSELRFSGDGHFLVRSKKNGDVRRTSETGATKHRRICRWCLVRETKNRQTVYICEACDVPLCLEGCFKKYHTVL